MRGVTLFTTTVALAVPAIMWPPRPVRAEVPVQPVAAQIASATMAAR